MRIELNRRDYIRSLDALRDKVAAIGKEYAEATLASASEIERDRMKKTAKLFGDLAMRLFEDAAVTLKILEANEAAGIGEQAVFDLREPEPEPTPEPPPPETAGPTEAEKPAAPDVPPCKHFNGEGCGKKDAPCYDGVCDGKDDGCPCYKAGKGKKPGKKGGK